MRTIPEANAKLDTPRWAGLNNDFCRKAKSHQITVEELIRMLAGAVVRRSVHDSQY